MAKILLINPSYFRTYGSTEGGLGNPIYPVMSLAAIGGAARKAGHEVTILDMSYMRYSPALVCDTILREKPDVVGITATTPLANQMRDISFLIKKISKAIMAVAGGPHPTALPRETVRQSALDVVVYGEGDATIVELLDGMSLPKVEGIVWRNGEEIVQNPKREMIDDLDNLAMPAWDLYPADVYRKYVTRIIAKRTPVSTVEFSRGCVFLCDFCASKNTLGLGYRKKSPGRCAEEMLLLERLGYREAVLADDIFTSDNNWAVSVCEEFIKRGVRMSWTCTNGIRVDSAKDELFRIMKRAGCYRVHFGFESGNDNVLKAFGKGGRATLQQGIDAVNTARRVGMETFGMFMLGLSADTETSMQETIDYAKRVQVDAMRFGITVPFPGTQMFDELRRNGQIKSYDWDLYTVYNDAQQIYEHPNMSWDVIRKYFEKSHREVYLQNPGYIMRRLLKSLRNLEIVWDAYYFFKLLRFMSRSKDKQSEQEDYWYREEWGKLGVRQHDLIYVEPQRIKANRREISLTS